MPNQQQLRSPPVGHLSPQVPDRPTGSPGRTLAYTDTCRVDAACSPNCVNVLSHGHVNMLSFCARSARLRAVFKTTSGTGATAALFSRHCSITPLIGLVQGLVSAVSGIDRGDRQSMVVTDFVQVGAPVRVDLH